MAKSKIDIIYDMVNLAYDVKRQCGRDKTLNYYIGDYARDVIKAKDEKVYDEFIYLAKQLEEEGWEEFIDWSKNLIKEYNQIEESKKSMKESEENFVYYIAVYDEDGNCRGYLQNESWRITQDIDKAMHFKRDVDAREVILKATKRAFNDDELYIEGMYLNESKESARKSLKEEKEVWIIKSKDDLQYVGKKIFDVCEDIENARKFKSKFEAEEFLKKHDKALDYRYWKVINIVSESKESVRKSIKEGRIDKDAVVYEFTCLLNRLGYSGVDYSNKENNEKCDDIVYMIMDLLKTMPRL